MQTTVNRMEKQGSIQHRELPRNFAGGPVVENLLANAWDMGSIFALGRFHMPQSNLINVPQLLSLHILKPVLCSKKSHCKEKPMHHN